MSHHPPATPERYLVPARVSFTQVFVSLAGHPSDAPAVMASLSERIDRGDDPSSLGDAPPFGREAIARNEASLAAEYGSAFAEALRELPLGAWSPPIETRFGVHRVRITARVAPTTLTVAQAGARLVADWRDDQRETLDRSVRDRLRARLPLRQLDAQVERRQREHPLPGAHPRGAEGAREAQPVHQPEGRREDPRVRRRDGSSLARALRPAATARRTTPPRPAPGRRRRARRR